MPGSVTVCAVPGDGIGPEVTACALRVLAAVGVEGRAVHVEHHDAGHGALGRTGSSLPEATLAAARAADAVLVGAMDAARIPADAVQPLDGLRRGLDVHASVRPARSFAGVPGPVTDLDVVVVREVTEGMYAGIEYPVGDDGACAVRVITRRASTRVAEVAFAEAARRGGLVTAVHKLGALRVTDRLFLDAVEEVAARHPEVTLETRNVDACAMELIREPGRFDVVLATNAFGDILSDVAIGLGGGLGLAPSACVGEHHGYVEPVHGTAPDLVGRGVANPLAAILSVAMLLRGLGADDDATRVEAAVDTVLADGRVRTADLGGSAGSDDVTDAVLAALA